MHNIRGYTEFTWHIDERRQATSEIERGLSARAIEELQEMIPRKEPQDQE